MVSSECISWNRNLFTTETKELWLQKNQNNNGQPGAAASFLVNRWNEPEILLSLWASRMIQPSQISVCMKQCHHVPPSEKEACASRTGRLGWWCMAHEMTPSVSINYHTQINHKCFSSSNLKYNPDPHMDTQMTRWLQISAPTPPPLFLTSFL